MPSPSVSSAAAAEDLGRAPAGVVLVLDLPAAVLVEEDVAGERVLGDDQGRAVKVHHAQAAGVDAGQRPEAAVGRGGGLTGSAEQKQGRAEGVEDEDVGLADRG